MAVNLIATAMLNTGPYVKGLKTIRDGTAAVGASTLATGKAGQAVWTDNERAAKAYTRGLNENTKAQNKMTNATRKSGLAMAQSLSSSRYLMHDLSRQAQQATLALLALPAAALIAGAAWEKNFARVVRTSDLKDNMDRNEGRINALKDSLVGMAQAMPATFGDITEVAMLANQMGIAATETAEFTRAVIMFSEASGVSVDIAATAFGRLKSLVRDVGSDYIGLADSILKVGVNSVATEAEIINVTTQISSIAAQAGFTSKEMIGLSGAMASVRVPPELSRGVVTRVFGQIDKAVSAGGTGLDTLARISGRTSEQFKAQWGTEGAAGVLFTDLIRGLHEAGTSARSEIESLGITSVRDVPVLLRLANAADSNGGAGGLLAQTMKDAHEGAGETQKQYTIMAETVVGKLKILGNNLVAFFAAAGESSLGPFGGFLDSISSKLREFTRSMDEPFKLFGSLEMPWTNAEGLGFITNLALMAAGITALGSLAFKGAAGAIGLTQLGMVLFGRGGNPGVLAALAGRAGIGGNAAVLASSIAATGVAAQRTSRFAAGMSSGLAAAGAQWRNVGTAARTATHGGLAVAANQLGRTATAGKAMNTALSGAAYTAVPATTGALGRLVKFGLGPVGIGIGVATAAVVGGVKSWAKHFYDATTTAKEFSNAIAGIDTTNMIAMDKALQSISVSGANQFWATGEIVKSVTPFANGVEGYREAISSLSNVYKHAKGSGPISIPWLTELTQFGSRTTSGLWDEVDGAKLVGEGVQSMVDSGDSARALSFIRTLYDDVDDLKYVLESTEGAPIKDLLDTTFGAAGLAQSDANLHKFLNGALKELSHTVTGFAEGDKISDILFGGDVEQMGKFANVLDEAAAAFIDFSGALESGWKGADGEVLENFNLANYTNELRDSMAAQKEWSEDMVTVSEYASSGLIEQLASLGPAAAPLLAALADELGEGVTTSLDVMEEALVSKTAGLGNALAESMANRAWVRQATGDSTFAEMLLAELGDDRMSQVYDAARGVGDETVRAILQALARGEIDFDQALQELLKNQEITPPVIDFTDITDEVGDSLQRAFSAMSLKINATVEPETTISELKSKLNDPELNSIEIDGSLTLTEAYAESREFQVWAMEQEIAMYLGASDLPAKLSIAALVAYARNEKIAVEIEALGAPAEKAIWEIVTLADGTRGYVQVDAHNILAKDKIYVIDELTGQPREIPITGENKEAIQSVLDVRTEASRSPANINVRALDYATSVINGIVQDRTMYVRVVTDAGARVGSGYGSGTMTVANGGVIDYYAQGGVRENHTAQIAPAGSWRVWGEPETGGEAYIPLSKTKRMRSMAILNDVANRFGYDLAAQNSQVAAYARGGFYDLQARQSYARMRNNMAGYGNAGERKEINFHFVNPVERDWAQDTWDKAQLVGSLL